MGTIRRGWGLVLSLVALAFVGPLSAADSPEILRSVPKQAGLVLVVENPRLLVDTALELRAVQDALTLPPVREVLDNTGARLVLQFLKYVERETGEKWPTLLDKLAGKGAALSVSYGPEGETDSATFVLEGLEAASVSRIFELAIRSLEEERARQGNMEPLKRTRQGEADVVEIEKDFTVARLGTRTFLTNKPEGLTASLELAAGKGESLHANPSIAKAQKLLPKQPLAWFWLDFAAVKQYKAARDFFEATRKDITQTLVFGSTADCLRRSDFVTGAFVREAKGLRLAVRLPAGRDGFPPEFALHVPPAGQPGTLPLLEPPGVLYSESLYLDLAKIWTERAKLLNPEVLKEFEKGEKEASKLVPGTKLGELLTMWGGYHRFVVVNLDKPPYKTEPGQKSPGFGYATTMRNPQFGKSVEGLLRAGGFIASLSQGLKLVEETVDGVKIFGYRFPENRKLADDEANIRFNFEPTFAVVGDQFLAGSTLEVTKKLIAEVRRTAKLAGAAPVWRAKAYARAGAEALAAAPEATISDAMLRQAISLAEAKKQVDQIGDYLRTLGTFTIEVNEPAKRYNFDLVWRFK